METSLQAPPRNIKSTLLIRTFFGDLLQQIGWGLTIFSMVFVWIFVADSELVSLYEFRGELATAQGTIEDTWETNMEINEMEVVAHGFHFEVPGVGPVEAVSYTTGREVAEGTSVEVEYSVERPHNARIKGMRAHQVGYFAAFVLIFPVVGLILLFKGFMGGIKRVDLLRNGLPAMGRMVDMVETNVEVNDEMVYELFYEFEAADGSTQRTSHKTHKTEQYENDAERLLLYSPQDPSYGLLFDGLPGRPAIGPDGRVGAPGLGGTLLVILLPLACVFENVLFLLFSGLI